MSLLYAGTSGLVLPVKNKLAYPEEYRDKSRLHYYSILFNTIEVNSIFYKLPQRKTVERWCSEVSGNFKFTFKLSKQITHAPALQYDPSFLRHYLELINVPQSKRGCVLVQFPGKLTAEFAPQVKKILKVIADHEWKTAVEFRNESWYTDSTVKMLKKYDSTCVIHDLKPFGNELLYANDIVYVRFHGTEKNYRGTYSDDLLLDYSSRILNWVKEGRDVYAYFNNTLGPAAENLCSLKNIVTQLQSVRGRAKKE